MPPPRPSLFLITPPVEDLAAFRPILDAACRTGLVAAVLLRLPQANERAVTDAVKSIAPAVQSHDAALILLDPGEIDLAQVAFRSGADGVHVTDPADIPGLLPRMKGERDVGTGALRSRHEAMAAGEAGAAYLLFGEPRPDGYVPPLADVVEMAQWWAEIFETPCVAYAPRLSDVRVLAATGAEFVALGDAVWSAAEGPEAAIRAAGRLITAEGEHAA